MQQAALCVITLRLSTNGAAGLSPASQAGQGVSFACNEGRPRHCQCEAQARRSFQAALSLQQAAEAQKQGAQPLRSALEGLWSPACRGSGPDGSPEGVQRARLAARVSGGAVQVEGA